MNMQSEPVAASFGFVGVVNAVFLVLGTLGVHVSGETVNAINILLTVAVGYVARTQAVAVAKHESWVKAALAAAPNTTTEQLAAKVADGENK